jgi:hypothetical protein
LFQQFGEHRMQRSGLREAHAGPTTGRPPGCSVTTVKSKPASLRGQTAADDSGRSGCAGRREGCCPQYGLCQTVALQYRVAVELVSCHRVPWVACPPLQQGCPSGDKGGQTAHGTHKLNCIQMPATIGVAGGRPRAAPGRKNLGARYARPQPPTGTPSGLGAIGPELLVDGGWGCGL